MQKLAVKTSVCRGIRKSDYICLRGGKQVEEGGEIGTGCVFARFRRIFAWFWGIFMGIKGISSTSVRDEFRSGVSWKCSVVSFVLLGRPTLGSIEQTILRNSVA